MIILLMGVAGSGKTTVGGLLASELGWEYVDADSFHPPQNVAKMRAGIPLDDEDRAPWLASLAAAISMWIRDRRNVVLGCSALKEIYRKRLCVSDDVKLVYLRGEYELIRQRLEGRHGHYLNADLLRSQFEALEEPSDAITVDVTQPPEKIVQEILRALRF